MEDVFSTKIEKSRKNNKKSSPQIVVVGNFLNDPLNFWSIYYCNKDFLSDQAFN